MVKVPDDVISATSDNDLNVIRAELGKSETKSDAESSIAKQMVEKASPEVSIDTTVKNAPVQEATPEKASEGEKTPSTEVNPPEVKQRRVSQSVPYERFKEVNTKLQDTMAELIKLRSTPPNFQQELDEFGQPVPVDRNWVKQEVTKTVQEVLEPVVTTLDKQMDDSEREKALESRPEAKKFEKEIKAYANATNLTYEDIVSLVLAKHSKPVSQEAVKQAELEAQEAELSGKSNSAAKRKTPTMSDVKNLSTNELEKLVDQIK